MVGWFHFLRGLIFEDPSDREEHYYSDKEGFSVRAIIYTSFKLQAEPANKRHPIVHCLRYTPPGSHVTPNLYFNLVSGSRSYLTSKEPETLSIISHLQAISETRPESHGLKPFSKTFPNPVCLEKSTTRSSESRFFS